MTEMNRQTNSVEKVINDAGILIVIIASMPNIYDENDKQDFEKFMKKLGAEENFCWQKFSIFSSVKNVMIEQYIKRGLDNAREMIRQHEPLHMRDIDTYRIDEEDFKLSITLKNLKVHDLSKIQTERVKSDVNNSTVECVFSIPRLKVTGIYSLIGTVGDYNVEGNGSMEIILIQFEVAGWIKISETNQTGTSIDALKLDYNFDDIQTTFDGLEVKGVDEAELKHNLAGYVEVYLRNKKDLLMYKLSTEIRKSFNENFDKCSSKEIVKLLSDGAMFLFK